MQDRDELVERQAIVDVKTNYATGLDAKDWVLWRSVFLPETIFDLSSWNRVPAKKLNADKVVKVQARVFAELKATQHFFTNHRVTISGDSARCVTHMRAEHWIYVEPNDKKSETKRYTMFGYYDDKLVRTSDGWKIAEMQLNVTHTEGDPWVMSESERRARERKAQEG